MVLQGNVFGVRREFVRLCHLDAVLVIFMNSADELRGSKQDREVGVYFFYQAHQWNHSAESLL